MSIFDRHLDDSTLRLLALDAGAQTPRQAGHLRSCARCQARRVTVADALDDVRLEADAAADAHFSAADLDRQRRSIMGRLTRGGRAARVLHFPGHEIVSAAPRADRRWLAAAAAAGLVLGALAGQLPHLLRPVAPVETAASVGAPSRSGAADALADDTLLSEVEAALDEAPRSALAALDALTPVHYEIR